MLDLLFGIWPQVLAGLGALVGVAVAYFKVRKGGRDSLENEILRDAEERERRGRNAVSKEQADADGLSSSDLVDRLRRRSGDFGGM